jgi:hypothetical protein
MLLIGSGMRVLFITILFAHRDKKDKTQVLPTYEVFSLKLHITNITHIHMKKSVHINESIPVTITRVKETSKTVKEGGRRLVCFVGNRGNKKLR